MVEYRQNDDKLQGMTAGHDSRPPPRWVLCGLLALALFPPWAARAFGWPVADFAMFSRIERYHWDLSVELDNHWQPVAVRSLRISLVTRVPSFCPLPATASVRIKRTCSRAVCATWLDCFVS